MANKELKFKVSQEGAQKVADDVGKIYEENKNLSKGLKGVSDAATKGGTALTAMAVAGGAAIAGLISLSEEQTRQETQLAAVIKSTGGAAGLTAEQVKNMASALQSQTAIGDEAILQGQNMLLTYTNIGADSFPGATQALLDMTTAMSGGAIPTGEQLRSQAIQLGKALNDPIAGITALGRAGVQFTDEQKAMIQTMVDANDVAGAQAIILGELETQFGGSAAAQAETFAGQMASLKNTLGDLGEEIGAMLIPIIQKIVPVIENVVTWLSELDDRWKKLGAVVLVGATAFAAVVGPMLLLVGALPAVIAGFGTLIGVITAIGAPLILAGLAVGALVAAIIVYWDQIKAATSAAWDWIKEKVMAVAEFGKEAFKTMVDVILTTLNILFPFSVTIAKAFIENWDAIKEFVIDVAIIIAGFFIDKWNEIKDNFITVWTFISEFFVAVWDGIVSTVVAAVDMILAWFGTSTEEIAALWDSLWSSFSGVITTYIEVIKSTINDVLTFITDKVDAILTTVSNAWDKVKSLALAAGSAVAGNAASAASAAADNVVAEKFANGGVITGPTLALMGEAGMNEAVVPLPNGRSIPVAFEGGGPSRGTTILHQGDVYINNKADVDQYFQEVKRRLIEEMQLKSFGSVTA